MDLAGANSLAHAHKKDEVTLRDESQQAAAAALFASIGDGAIATDEYGKIIQVNPVAQAILGFSAKELINQWFPKKIVAFTVDEEPISLIDRPITRAFLTGQPVSEKLLYRRKDNSLVPVSISISPIILKGRPIGAIQVFRDITVEQEIDRMKSEFISLASHQLRTPLSAIKTYSHMLVDGYMGEITPAQRKSLRTIIASTNRMNELISTLLNITRIESGTIAVTPKLLQMETIAEEVIKETSLLAADKSISVKLKPTANHDLSLETDSLIIKEVLSNLVSNAIKYTPDEGCVTVKIRAKNDQIIVSVTDTGWGIPKYAQDQIFSKFFRAHNIVKRETTGTGLGLYLVKGLLDRLGGKIWFDSIEGSGSSFYFSLPKAIDAQSKRTKKPNTG